MAPKRTRKQDGPMTRYWMFTFNNPTDIRAPEHWPHPITFCVWQRECGKNGTVHLQGYVIFDIKKRFSTLKKIDKRIHWEPRYGTHAEAKAYCQKEDTRLLGPWTIGTDVGIRDSQGKRSDLDDVKQAIDEGQDETYLWDNHFASCAKYIRSFREYRRQKTPHRQGKTKVEVVWGPTGTGKSHYAEHKYPDAYWKPKGDWWDGYDGQEVVVIDEFYGWLSYDFMLRLLDRYRLIVPTKFGHANFVAKTIVITSNKHPSAWYNGSKYPWEPLERRIETTTLMETPYQAPADDQPAADHGMPSPILSPPSPSVVAATDFTAPDYVKRWGGVKDKGKEPEATTTTTTTTPIIATVSRPYEDDHPMDDKWSSSEEDAVYQYKRPRPAPKTRPVVYDSDGNVMPRSASESPRVTPLHPDHCHQSPADDYGEPMSPPSGQSTQPIDLTCQETDLPSSPEKALQVHKKIKKFFPMRSSDGKTLTHLEFNSEDF